MSKSDVLRYIFKQYRDGEITRQELQSWMQYHSASRVRARIETTAKRLLSRSSNHYVQPSISR